MWAAGNLAVCIDDTPCRCESCGGEPFPIRRRAIHRVIEAYWDSWHEAWALSFSDVLSGSNHVAFNACRFRKIVAADETFTNRIRKARREKEPA